MITLITGTPGAGKTLYAVAELLNKEYAGRPLHVDGIPELLLDHEPAQDPLEWHEWIPQGKDAVFVVDECQRVWRPRHYGKEVPPSVSAFETHRHMGVDVVLITQHPNLLDSNVRRLVGRHIHVRRLWGMGRTMVYEWDGATDPQRTSTAISSQWKYPKKAFQLYKSATAHTARKQKMPASLWLLALAVVGIPAAGYFGYQSMFGRFQEPDIPVATVDPSPAVEPGLGGALAAALPGSTAEKIEGWHIDNWEPRHPHYPESAPAYDHLTEVKSFPKLSACVDHEFKGCNCYTQQGTWVDIPYDVCMEKTRTWHFDPYREPGTTPQELPGISQSPQVVGSPALPEPGNVVSRF